MRKSFEPLFKRREKRADEFPNRRKFSFKQTPLFTVIIRKKSTADADAIQNESIHD